MPEGDMRVRDQREGALTSSDLTASFVLFCFVWLATLGVPVVASGTAAGPFRRVVEAP